MLVLKRSMNPGFSGIDNELFIQPNTMMVLGDAKKTLLGMVSGVKQTTEMGSCFLNPIP